MPSNWLTIDNNFPSFTGEESPGQQIRALHNYLFQLREGLQYSLQNLTADNFNAAALQNLSDAQKNEVTLQLEKVYALLSQMSAEINSLSGRVSGVESLSGRMDAAEDEITAMKDRVTLTEKSVEDLGEWLLATEGDIDGLQRRVGTVESDIGSLKDRATVTEGSVEGLAGRVKVLEDDKTLGDLQEAVTGEGGLQERTEALEGAVTGEGGLQEQMGTAQQEIQKISGAMQVADDGGVAVGAEGKPLRLVGQVYINGVLFGQGGTT